MIYVDPLLSHGWILRSNQVKSCHLFADTVEELHAFALKIGMRIEWFQNKEKLLHYDLTPDRRARAVRAGAREVTRRELVEFMRTGKISVTK